MRLFLLLSASFFSQVLTQTCNSTFDVGIDRPGYDYSEFNLSTTDATLCESACCKDDRCDAWTYAVGGSVGPTPLCFLKSNVPNKNVNAICTSGVVLADNTQPFQFGAQFQLQATVSDSTTGDTYVDTYYYDSAGKLVLYRSYPSGKLISFLDRYDKNVHYTVIQEIDTKNGTIITTCSNETIDKGTAIFPPSLLKTLQYNGSAIIDEQSTSQFIGNVSGIGTCVWYENNAYFRGDLAPVRSQNNWGTMFPFASGIPPSSEKAESFAGWSYQFDVTLYDSYLENPSVFDQPITLCP